MAECSQAFTNLLKKMGFHAPYQRHILLDLLYEVEKIKQNRIGTHASKEVHNPPSQVDDFVSCNNEKYAFEGLRDFTQNLFRLENKTHDAIHDNVNGYEEKDPYLRADLAEKLRILGLAKEIKPKREHYAYAIILGARNGAVEQRIRYEKMLTDHGVDVKRIILLGDRDKESSMMDSLFNNIHTTEIGAVHNSRPCAKLANLETPSNGNGRATTRDTIIELCKQYAFPKGTRLLFITNQPHIAYQNAVIENTLRDIAPDKNYTVEVVGPSCPLTERGVHIALDTLARYIYEKGKQLYPETYPERPSGKNNPQSTSLML